MRLYVANTSKQHHIFAFRFSKGREAPVTYQTIPVGSQIQVGGGSADLNQETVDFIIGQHLRYGMVPVSELARNKHFVGLVYSIDKPVPMGDKFIETVEELNPTALNDSASTRREHGAAGVADLLEKAVAGTGVTLNRAEVIVSQEGDAATVSEGVEILKEGLTPRHAPSKERKAGGRRR